VIERIQEIHEFVHEYQRGMRMEIKAGIYMLEDYGNEIGLAIDRAKMALSTIKKRYDADYKFYDSSMEKDREKKQYIVDHMDEAMAKGWIKVFYQPVVRTLTGEICGVEALARWEDPLRGKISPADFIEVLEEAHLIHYLDLYILEKVCKTFTTIKSENLFKQPASINLSRYDFQLSNIYEQVNEIVESYEVPKDLIHIEIT
jgi:predicted signal transduction protein with EAL and GGDEF domain